MLPQNKPDRIILFDDHRLVANQARHLGLREPDLGGAPGRATLGT